MQHKPGRAGKEGHFAVEYEECSKGDLSVMVFDATVKSISGQDSMYFLRVLLK